MGWFRQGFLVAKGNYSRWRSDERIWFVFIIIAILIVEYYNGFTRYGLDYGKTITPFVLPLAFGVGRVANGMLKILVYIGALVLFSDAPFMDLRKPYVISRIGRRSWWLGECLYIWGTALIYIIFIMAMSTIVVLPTASTSDLWGSTIRDLLPAPREFVSYMHMYIPDTCKFIYPSAAQLYTLWSAWLSFSLLGMLIYLCGLYTGNSIAGLVISMALIALDPIIWGISGVKKGHIFFSPVSWTSLDNLNVVDAENTMSIMQVAVLSILLIIILMVFIAKRSKKIVITVNTLQ